MVMDGNVGPTDPRETDSQPKYEPMNNANMNFLAVTREMYDIQENDPRFAEKGEINIDLPGMPGFIVKKDGLFSRACTCCHSLAKVDIGKSKR